MALPLLYYITIYIEPIIYSVTFDISRGLRRFISSICKTCSNTTAHFLSDEITEQETGFLPAVRSILYSSGRATNFPYSSFPFPLQGSTGAIRPLKQSLMFETCHTFLEQQYSKYNPQKTYRSSSFQRRSLLYSLKALYSRVMTLEDCVSQRR